MANASGSVFGTGATLITPTTTARIPASSSGSGGIEYFDINAIRGTVLAHAWPGVTVGTGLDSATRQANGTALQAAITYASNNKKILEFWPGTYEFELAGGLIVPDGYSNGIIIKGGRGVDASILKQYTDNTPILTCGSDVGNGYKIDIDGLTFRYGNSQSGNTNSDCLRIKACWKSTFRYLDAEGGYNNFHINGGDFFFQNIIEHIKGHSAIQNIFYWQRFGTGNIFRDLYLHQGGAPTTATLGGSVFRADAGGAAQSETVIEQLNIEWGQCNTPMYLKGLRNVTFISTHFEGGILTGSDPALVYIEGSDVAFNGGYLLNNKMLAANVTSGKPSFIRDGYNSSVKVSNFTTEEPSTTTNDTEWYGFSRAGYEQNDAPSLIELEQFKFISSASGYPVAVNFSPTSAMSLSNYPNVRWGAIGKVTQYAGMPIIERARLTMTGSTYTLYGHFNDTFILSPTNAGATRTVTLSNKMGPTGSIGENMTTPHGRMAHVYRRTGTADAFDLIVKNHDGTTLSTITTSDTKKSFYFNDTDWVLG